MRQQDRADVLDDATGSFDVVIRGYERSQVHGRLDRLGHELGVLRADRDASAARAEKLAGDLAAAHAETESLRGKAPAADEPNFQSMGARISNLLKRAEEEAADIRRVVLEEQNRSRTEVESMAKECAWMRTEAQDEARRVVEDAHDEARRALAEGENSATRIVADAQNRADEMTSHAHASVEQVETQGRMRMAKLTDDFDLTMQSRRAEAARIEQERDQASRHDVKTRIEQAQGEAENLVAVAEQRVAELDAQRVEIYAWLTQLRQTLATVPAIDATPDTSPIRAAGRPPASGRHGAAVASTPAAQRLPAGSAGASTTVNSGSEQAPYASPNIARTLEPSGSQARPAIHDPDPDSEGARPGRTVLAREDILEYRHTRRRVR